MEYHAHRFKDASLMFFKGDNLVAILPANLKDSSILSHEGLTFGGLFLENKSLWSEIINSLARFVAENEIKKVVLKPIPNFISKQNLVQVPYLNYHPFRTVISSQEINLVIPNINDLKVQYRRRRCYKKAIKANLKFGESEQWDAYWTILEKNLWERHQRMPIHSLQEISYLKKLFPENIKLYTASFHNEIVAGTVVYFYPNQVAHCQYLATTPFGRINGALDFVIFNLQHSFNPIHTISLGVSTLREKNRINQGLYAWKAGFGARPQIHYSIDMSYGASYNSPQENKINFMDVAN